MNEKNPQFGGTGKTKNRIIKQNLRTIMQALHNCRKNCAECREEETEWEAKIMQKETPHA